MFRVSLANAFAKRTCKPLYEKHQATPFSGTLAATHVTSPTVYSGMVAALNSSGEFAIADGAAAAPTGNPWGLFALDCNPTINDLDGQPSGTAPFAVWTGGPDALFQVTTLASDATKGAFANTGDYAVGDKLFAGTGGDIGQLTKANSGSDVPVGRVVQVVSSTVMVIQLSSPSTVEVA